MPIIFIDRPGGDFWSGWQNYVQNHLLARGLIGANDLALYKITDSIDEAAQEVRHFYSNYHSLRYARDEVILRLHRAPDASQLASISREFADIKPRGDFRVCGALPVEHDESALASLPRLVFNFNRRDHGRLRMLINFLNDMPVV